MLARTYGLPPNSPRAFLYYPVRAQDLWRRYGRISGDVVRGEPGARDAIEQARRLLEWMTPD